MKAGKMGRISGAVLTGAISAGCIPYNVLSTNPPDCVRETDHTWVEETPNPMELYGIRLKYHNGLITLDEAFLDNRYFHVSVSEENKDYQAVLLNRFNQPIYKKNFTFPIHIISEDFPYEVTLNRAEWTIHLPAREDALRIDIYNLNCRKVLSVPVSELQNR